MPFRITFKREAHEKNEAEDPFLLSLEATMLVGHLQNHFSNAQRTVNELKGSQWILPELRMEINSNKK